MKQKVIRQFRRQATAQENAPLACSPQGKLTVLSCNPQPPPRLRVNLFSKAKIMKHRYFLVALVTLLLALWLIVARAVQADPSLPQTRLVFTNETAFLNTVVALGYAPYHEGFEDDNAWGSVRSLVNDPNTASSITHLGLTWTANNVNSEITTGNGPVRTGEWGFYALPHGDPVNGINDGWIGAASETLYAVGGWIETNTPPASLALILDGNEADPVDFPDDQLGTQHKFFGVIDTAGFTQFEFRETEAAPPDELKYIFGDDFFWATAADNLQPAPLQAWNILVGTPQGGGLAALQVSDDNYASVLSAPSGSRQIVGILTAAQSPLTTVSRLNVVVELAAAGNGLFTLVRLRNFDNNAWYTLGYFPITANDTRQYLLDAPEPDRFVRDSDGLVLAQIATIGYGVILPDGYTLRLDQVQVDVAP